MISYEMLCTTRRLFSTNSFDTESFLLMNLDEESFFLWFQWDLDVQMIWQPASQCLLSCMIIILRYDDNGPQQCTLAYFSDLIGIQQAVISQEYTVGLNP